MILLQEDTRNNDYVHELSEPSKRKMPVTVFFLKNVSSREWQPSFFVKGNLSFVNVFRTFLLNSVS